MSVKQIPDLASATALNGNEQLEAVQAGSSVKVTTAQIGSYINANYPAPGISSVTATSPLTSSTVSGAVTIALPSQSITNSFLATMPAQTLKANLLGSTAIPTDVTPSALLDTFGTQVGSILYRSSTGWTALTSGTNSQVLTATGTTSAPIWQTPPAAGSNTNVQYNSGGAFAADSGFVYSGGNVGIGASSPAAKLHVSDTSPSIYNVATGNAGSYQPAFYFFKTSTSSAGADFQGRIGWGRTLTDGSSISSGIFASGTNIAGSAIQRLTYNAYTNHQFTIGGSSTPVLTVDSSSIKINNAVSIATSGPTSWIFNLPAGPGSPGYVLSTDGFGNTSWVSASGSGTVTSVNVSGGTTGLTTSGGPVTTSGTITLAGTLAIANGGTGSTTSSGARTALGAASSGANGDITSLTGLTTALSIGQGGTGQTTASAAFNALSPVTSTGDLIIGNGVNSSTRLPIGTNGYVLTSNGTTATWAASGSGSGTVNSGIANQLAYYAATGTAVSGNANATISSGALTLGVAGSAAGSLLLSGSTSGAVTIKSAAAAGTWTMTLPTTAGTNGYVLSTDGAGVTSWIATSGGGGTVTSVNVSGGTTGLTTSGGPITGSGTITLAGTLAVANGGTGLTATPANGALDIGNGSGFTRTQLTPGTGVNITNGAGSITIANSGVTSFSAGTTGLTPSTGTTGAITLAGTLAIANGGTGQTTASAAFNALSPITTAGDLIIGNGVNSATRLPIGANTYILTSNGTTAVWSAPSVFSFPTAGIAVSTGSAWGTSLTAPTGTIVGTTDTQTLTNKWLQPRVLASTANSATPTLNTDSYDMMVITGQSVAITSFTTNLTGTPVNGQRLWIAITGTTAISISWGASFEPSTTALPTTTVSTNRLDIGFVWNAATSKWRCLASA